MQGWADDVDLGRKILTIEENVIDQRQGKAVTGDKYEEETAGQAHAERLGKRKEGKRFDVGYDKLIVTVGCYSRMYLSEFFPSIRHA